MAETLSFFSVLDRFYDDLITVERKSVLTAQTYKIAVKELLDWCDRASIAYERLSIQDLLHYLVERKAGQKGASGADELTVAKDISAIRSFGVFLTRSGIHCAFAAASPGKAAASQSTFRRTNRKTAFGYRPYFAFGITRSCVV